LAEFPGHERVVPEAAVMRRHFDWEILPAASRQFPEVVSCALVREADRVLFTAGRGKVPVSPRPDREAVLMSALPARLRRGRRTPPVGWSLPRPRADEFDTSTY
jgi:hypothetical protein